MHIYINIYMLISYAYICICVCVLVYTWVIAQDTIPKNDSWMPLKTYGFPNMQHTLKNCLKSKSKYCPCVRGYQGIAMFAKVWTILGVGITRDLKGFEVVTLEVMVPLGHIIKGSFKRFWFRVALGHLSTFGQRTSGRRTSLLEFLHSIRLSACVCDKST